ncbi:hypothetical protein AC478_01775 [miscellaneous Crenarchaeota group-1 archaeon SG8-32-3]|uniref:Sodium/calcium exchanger membrane region domain-containing protein n=1 Tax=miscellaneous Crenarchaeota group-1 archaeon SG8-32-3 TaxID=1685125 RepID=A0A0M0BTZ2_9ARCH|nr:MAG: hypothetical protein AC478_01775 [miscellaneous Crenarchaeota group-1 archaeon SG8-32-3]
MSNSNAEGGKLLEGLGLLPNVCILIVALIILTKASNLAVAYSINVASIAGMWKTTLGFIIVALSKSLPELFRRYFSLLDTESVDVSIGNVLGSDLVNI